MHFHGEPNEARCQDLICQQQLLLAKTLSHELRTPLSAVMGYSEIFAAMTNSDTLPSRVEIQSMAAQILASSERLMASIQRLELWAELERYEFGWSPGGIASNEVCLCDAAALSRQIGGKAARVRRSGDVDVALVHAAVSVPRSAWVTVVVDELVDNALKFSAPGTPVRVESFVGNGRWTVTVCDQGRGMTVDQIAKVAAFRQFDRLRFEQQGFGLGLRIAQLFARHSGGDLAFESGSGNRGLKVSFSVPLAVATMNPVGAHAA